eukprot:11999839-Alexandrium_andersonii.AAC.1
MPRTLQTKLSLHLLRSAGVLQRRAAAVSGLKAAPQQVGHQRAKTQRVRQAKLHRACFLRAAAPAKARAPPRIRQAELQEHHLHCGTVMSSGLQEWRAVPRSCVQPGSPVQQ